MRCCKRSLGINDPSCILAYASTRPRQRHAGETQRRYGYRRGADSSVGFRLARWLYALCWTGTDRPGELFNRATTWLLTHKVLLPGVTVLERFIAQRCSRVEERLWLPLCRSVTDEQTQHLQELLVVVEGNHYSRLDQLGSGPVMISGPALIRASR